MFAYILGGLVARAEAAAKDNGKESNQMNRARLSAILASGKLRQDDVKRLRKLWDAGVASGDFQQVDMKALRDEARKRLETARKARFDVTTR